MSETQFDYNEITPTWEDSQMYAPTSRHRKRLIKKIIKRLDYETCLDVGCGQGYLIKEIMMGEGIRAAGCDISKPVIEKLQKTDKSCDFFVADISKKSDDLPDKKFDLVICSEVVEHIDDFKTAIFNLCRMSKQYLLITVPTGKIYDIDKYLGHVWYPTQKDLSDRLNENAYKVLVARQWGFPFLTFYKWLIDFLGAGKVYKDYTGKYSGFQKLIAFAWYLLFFINNFFSNGLQLIVLAERTGK